MASKLCVIIPCLNEVANIEKTILQVHALFSQEIDAKQVRLVVVDNGSTDGTLEILDKCQTQFRENLEIMRCPTRGKANAIAYAWGGSKSAQVADYVLLIDADLEYDLSILPTLWRTAQEEHLDMVYTKRSFAAFAMTLSSFFANKVILWMFEKQYGVYLYDVFTGVRLMKKHKFNISSQGFVLETDLMIQLMKQGLTYECFEINYHPRVEGKKINGLDFLKILYYFVRKNLPWIN